MDLLLAEDLSQIDEARPGIAISGKRLPHRRCCSISLPIRHVLAVINLGAMPALGSGKHRVCDQ